MTTPAVIACMATMPGRERALSRAVRSLIPQVSRLIVYANGYEDGYVPATAVEPRVEFMTGVDLGDAGKFWHAVTHESTFAGYYLTCDDDLDYAPGYVRHMLQAVERYRRQAVVSLHGKAFERFPVESYYRTPGRKVRCLVAEPEDVPVQFPGTGAMAWHTDTVRFISADFPHKNMADVLVGVALRRAGVPCIAVAHPEGIVRHLPIDFTQTIHARMCNDDALQTALVNEAFTTRQEEANA